MSDTTLLVKRSAMPTKPSPQCHGGDGVLGNTTMLFGGPESQKLRFCFETRLPPGTSIGIHPHPNSEEYYICLEGRGTMHMDGEDHAFEAGDISAIYPGGEHGLTNDSDADMRVIVFCV